MKPIIKNIPLPSPYFEMCWHIKRLLEILGDGLIPTGNSNDKLQSLFKILEEATNLELNHKHRECIDTVFQFTLDSFQEPVSLPQVAGIACMSVPSFCHYFKRRTQKTYIDFLNEVRVEYACHQLLETDKPVTEIGYESGYNTVVHFHRQFLRLKKRTPLQYRKALNTHSL